MVPKELPDSALKLASGLQKIDSVHHEGCHSECDSAAANCNNIDRDLYAKSFLMNLSMAWILLYVK
jgi:hypothetical protein